MLKYAWKAKSFEFRTRKCHCPFSLFNFTANKLEFFLFILFWSFGLRCSFLPISVKDSIPWSEQVRRWLASITISTQAIWTLWGACIQLVETGQGTGCGTYTSGMCGWLGRSICTTYRLLRALGHTQPQNIQVSPRRGVRRGGTHTPGMGCACNPHCWEDKCDCWY